ncbi:MAG: hypothetical protein PVH88_11540 [Ignavibacteria bacterium]|jgi:hypothetical protein
MLPETLKNAEYVVKLLQLDKFFSDYIENIYTKLEDLEQNLTEKMGGDVRFVADGLELISGIVHVGSSLKAYDKAIRWVDKETSSTDPGPIYALTFIYIVEEGYKKYQNLPDPDKKKIWESIYRRVESTLGP